MTADRSLGTAQRLRIFVVEDEMLVAVMLENMLSDLGHEHFATAATLDQAKEIVVQGGFDCAILDVNLNGESVRPVADVLARRAIPFAFATGYDRTSLPEPHRQRPVLRKPIELAELEMACRTMISASPR